jgi:hypothetical protein
MKTAVFRFLYLIKLSTLDLFPENCQTEPPKIKLSENLSRGHPVVFNPSNAKLNPICHLLALLAHHIFHVSSIRDKYNIKMK